MSRSHSPSADALKFGESCLDLTAFATDADADGRDSPNPKRQRPSMMVVAETPLPLEDTNAVGGSGTHLLQLHHHHYPPPITFYFTTTPPTPHLHLAAFEALPHRQASTSRIVEETPPQAGRGTQPEGEDEDEDHDDCVIVGSIPQEWIARNDFLCPLLYNLTLCSSQH
jgi:hypothetical protein